jgi:hypothetical protein
MGVLRLCLVRRKGVTASILQVGAIDVSPLRDQASFTSNTDWTTLEEVATAMLYLCTTEGGVVNGMRLPRAPHR